MISRLIVLLQGHRIGVIDRDRGGRVSFTYDEAWQTRPGATPLSTSMPLPIATHGHSVTEAFLWGLLPESVQVLERWSQRFHVSPRNPFSLLSTPIGEDCAGAVQLVSEDRVEQVQSSGDITWIGESDVAERLAELRSDVAAWLPAGGSGQFSLAGAQAKTALLFDAESGRWGLPSGRIPTTHILKPAIQGLAEHDLNEHLCLATARRLGLPASESWVGQFESQTAIVIRRYDRIRADGEWLRVHQEDLCQAFSLPPTAKYQNEGGPSPEAIADLLRERVQPSAQGEGAVRRFVDGLALNWLVAGTDAHAKNYSLLLSGQDVRMAPLYDVACAIPYNSDLRSLKLAMRIGREYRLRVIGARDWARLAANLSLEEDELLSRINQLAERLPDALEDASREEEVERLGSELPRRMRGLIADWVARCRRQLRVGRAV